MFKREVTTFRHMGAAALELAYVGCGRLDGLLLVDTHPWDVAAGALIVSEAGGKVTDFSGRPFSMDSKDLLATNGRIHGQTLALIRSSMKPGGAGP